MSWTFTGLMPWASIILTTGFALREYGAYQYKNVDILVANTVLIMSGPPVYALINYLILSRILYYVPYLSPIHPGRVLTTFLALDALCEAIIVNGALRVANTNWSEGQRKVGDALIKAGLLLQCAMFVAFVVIGAIFHLRANKAGVMKKNLKTVLILMYISSIIITARCIYRIVEYFQGVSGQVFRHEFYFYIFEASIMFFNTAMLNGFHPGRYLPRSNKVFLATDGKTELHGPGWQAKRNVLMTFIDPFDIQGLIQGKDKKNKFWEFTPDQLDELIETERREKAETKAKPRPAWQKIVDPIHFLGPNGKLMRLVEWMDGDDQIQTNAERLRDQRADEKKTGTDV